MEISEARKRLAGSKRRIAVYGNKFGDNYTNNHVEGYSVWQVKFNSDMLVKDIELINCNMSANEISKQVKLNSNALAVYQHNDNLPFDIN